MSILPFLLVASPRRFRQFFDCLKIWVTPRVDYRTARTLCFALRPSFEGMLDAHANDLGARPVSRNMSSCSRFVQAFFLVLATALTSAAANPESATVPLDNVWAHDMPGTRDIHLLQQEYDKRFPPMGGHDQSLVERISRIINSRRGRPVGEALAVQGKGVDALFNVFHEFVDQQVKPSKVKRILGKDGVSLFFFTAYSPRYVHLTEVSRLDTHITVKYDLIPHQTQNRTMHLALVPVGELPKGDYHVEVSQAPCPQEQSDAAFKDVDDKWREQYVSSSFTFHVD